MGLTEYLAFLLIAIVATASPGPAVLLAVTNAVTHGIKPTVFAILGNVLGVILLAAITSAGLGALMQASELVFQLVKWGGGIYLIYLGLRLWVQQVTPIPRSVAARNSPTQRQLFRQAFIVAVTNPKAIAFITALFPQFIEPTVLMLPQFALLAGTFGLLSFLFLLGYALLASRSSRWLLQNHLRRRFNRVSGGLFVGFGSLLITTAR